MPATLCAQTAPRGVVFSFSFANCNCHTASQVLRAAGYPRHALWVAESAGLQDAVLDILLEDCAAYDEALAALVSREIYRVSM